MNRIAASFLVFASFSASCAPSAATVAPKAPRPSLISENDLRAVLERARAKRELPGLAVAVVRTGDSVVAVGGVREISRNEKIAITDRFHIASCTKSMTAMLGAIAVEKRELEWSTRLADVLPEVAAKVRPEYRHATLEQLLAHRAQMPAYTQFGPERLEQLKAIQGTPTEQRLQFLTEVLSTESPNEGTGDAAYSNVGYTAAAAMLERASRTSWETLLTSRLTRPLGMSSVKFGWPATTQEPDQPRGHFTRAGRIVSSPLDDSYTLPIALWPAGAVSATIGDMALYAADQLNGLRGKRALLQRASYERLHRTPDGSESGFTLGWGVRRDPRWGVVHYGAGSGGTFFMRIFIVPEHDIALVAASNSGEAAVPTREMFEELLALHMPAKE
jgi:CubicO group peptidase (beta-lactamase class C family)